MRNISKNTRKRMVKIFECSVNLPEWFIEIDWRLKGRAIKKQFKKKGYKVKTTIYH